MAGDQTEGLEVNGSKVLQYHPVIPCEGIIGPSQEVVFRGPLTLILIRYDWNDCGKKMAQNSHVLIYISPVLPLGNRAMNFQDILIYSPTITNLAEFGWGPFRELTYPDLGKFGNSSFSTCFGWGHASFTGGYSIKVNYPSLLPQQKNHPNQWFRSPVRKVLE